MATKGTDSERSTSVGGLIMRSWKSQIIAIALLVWLASALILAGCSPASQANSIQGTAAEATPDQSLPPATPADTPQASTVVPESQPGTALLVVQYSPSDRMVRSIDATQPITGLAALEATGLNLVIGNFGDAGQAVCGIEGTGCPADNCFCSSKFWSYETWSDGAWQPYPSGPAGIEVKPGSIEGWHWTEFGTDTLPPAPALASAARAYDRLQIQQVPASGGYDSPSSSLEVLLALGANTIDPDTWQGNPGEPSFQAYWLENARSFSEEGPASAGKLAAALSAAKMCWPAEVIQPGAYYTGTQGIYSPHAGFQAWAMLGTLAISQTLPAESVDFLAGLVLPDGGWEWNQGFGSDTNTTSLVIQALLASGEPVDSPLVTQALAYLKAAQNPDGGFPYAPGSSFGTASDVNSTAYVLQAIYAANQDPGAGPWATDESNPIQYLSGMQLENGGFEWQKGSGENIVATAQAATALLGRVYPLRVYEPTACP
jgi:hypothetical protein